MKIKKTETIVRKDHTLYKECDFIDFLQLKIDIMEGKISEKLYFRDENNNLFRIHKSGDCEGYDHFSIVDDLLMKLVDLI